MSDFIWVGGVAATLWITAVSFFARRWWPPIYLCALIFGFGAGLLIYAWPEVLQSVWWFAWTVYLAAFPFYRMRRSLHRCAR